MKLNMSEMPEKEITEKILNIPKPKCPYCNEDVTYAYYGYWGKYCPNCMKNLKGDLE